MSYKCVIIGAGNKGALSDAPGTGNEHKYISYGHTIKDNDNFKLMGFADTDLDKRLTACDLWGGGSICAPEKYCEECFNIYYETDIAIVATPDDMHYQTLKRLATYPLKLVICEKPLCNKLEEAEEIIEIYKKAGIPLLIDYTRRFIPEYRKDKEEIEKGNWGKFIKGYCYYNRGTLHTLSHFVNMALWFNGNLDNIIIQEVETDYRWIYQWGLFYEKDFISEHAVNFRKNPKVPSMYDNHLLHVMENAYNYLEGKETLICDGPEALRTLKETTNYIRR